VRYQILNSLKVKTTQGEKILSKSEVIELDPEKAKQWVEAGRITPITVKCGSCKNFTPNAWSPYGFGECDKDIPQPGSPAWPNEPRVCNQWQQKGHVV